MLPYSCPIKIETREFQAGVKPCAMERRRHSLRAPLSNFVLSQGLLGKSAFDIEMIWDDLYAFSRAFGQCGAGIYVLSAIDIALWDILGKYLQKSFRT